MISSVDQLVQLPIVVVFYRSGSSGEFLSYAIGKTFDGMTQTSQFWENNNRCKYFDIFDRNLNSGFAVIDPADIVRNVNRYLEKNNSTETTHIATAHAHPATVEFLKRHLSKAPVVEIVMNNPLSKKFTALATYNKITHKILEPNKFPLMISGHSGESFERHLQIEWEDLIMTSTESVFQEISNFIGHTGDVAAFCSCVEDYRNRNLDLIKQANES
jgi:hypothetical protein